MEYIGKIENHRILCESREPIVVFGAGKEIKSLLYSLEVLQIKERVVCICDNNTQRQNGEVDNIQLCSLEYAISHYPNAMYMVYNRFSIEMSMQLIEKGIDRIHLLRG